MDNPLYWSSVPLSHLLCLSVLFAVLLVFGIAGTWTQDCVHAGPCENISQRDNMTSNKASLEEQDTRPPEESISSLVQITEQAWGFTYRSVGDPKAATTLKSHPRMDNDFCVAAQSTPSANLPSLYTPAPPKTTRPCKLGQGGTSQVMVQCLLTPSFCKEISAVNRPKFVQSQTLW